MTTEWLRYRVPLEFQPAFLQADADIWTTVLSRQPGFMLKQIWLNPKDPEEVNLVIQWQSKESWKSIPHLLLQETEQQFVKALGQQFELLEVLEYNVES
jgi:uncharacterized protein (TIGR03792 family)